MRNMGFSLKLHYCFLWVTVLLPALCHSHGHGLVTSRAAYYGSRDGLGTPSGACGLGEFGRTVNNASVTAVSGRLFRNGAGCGACYQIWCTIPQLCTSKGVNVMVTDHGEGDRTDFILSPRAFDGMAQAGAQDKLRAYGVVEVKYQRVSCRYENYLLKFKITEHSSNPYYLAIVILYQATNHDTTAVDISQKDHKEWIGMRRAYGAVFDMANPPSGPITLRFNIPVNQRYTHQEEYDLPSGWKAGDIYTIY